MLDIVSITAAKAVIPEYAGSAFRSALAES